MRRLGWWLPQSIYPLTRRIIDFSTEDGESDGFLRPDIVFRSSSTSVPSRPGSHLNGASNREIASVACAYDNNSHMKQNLSSFIHHNSLFSFDQRVVLYSSEMTPSDLHIRNDIVLRCTFSQLPCTGGKYLVVMPRKSWEIQKFMHQKAVDFTLFIIFINLSRRRSRR